MIPLVEDDKLVSYAVLYSSFCSLLLTPVLVEGKFSSSNISLKITEMKIAIRKETNQQILRNGFHYKS